MRTVVVLTAIITLSFSGSAAAQDSTPSSTDCNPTSADCNPFTPANTSDEAFLHLQIAFSALDQRARAGSDQSFKTLVERVGINLNKLQALFASGRGNADDEYIANLDFIAKAVLMVAYEPDMRRATAILEDIDIDLQAKLASSGSTLGGQGTKPGKIPVMITPRRSGQPAKGYTIKAAHALFAAYAPAFEFEEMENHVSRRRLTPGVYMIYVYDSDGREVRRQRMEIGLDGRPSSVRNIDLP